MLTEWSLNSLAIWILVKYLKHVFTGEIDNFEIINKILYNCDSNHCFWWSSSYDAHTDSKRPGFDPHWGTEFFDHVTYMTHCDIWCLRTCFLFGGVNVTVISVLSGLAESETVVWSLVEAHNFIRLCHLLDQLLYTHYYSSGLTVTEVVFTTYWKSQCCYIHCLFCVNECQWLVYTHIFPFIPNWCYLMIPNTYNTFEWLFVQFTDSKQRLVTMSVSLCTQTGLCHLTIQVLNITVYFLNILYTSLTSVHSNLEHGLAILTESFSPLKSELHNLPCWSPNQKWCDNHAFLFVICTKLDQTGLIWFDLATANQISADGLKSMLM